MTLASCCGQLVDTSPNDFLMLRTVALICAALLLFEAVLLFFGLRRSRDSVWQFWQNKLILCSLGLSVIAVVLVRYAQSRYHDALAASASGNPYYLDDLSMGSVGSPAIAYTIVLCAITLTMLGLGVVQLATEV